MVHQGRKWRCYYTDRHAECCAPEGEWDGEGARAPAPATPGRPSLTRANRAPSPDDRSNALLLGVPYYVRGTDGRTTRVTRRDFTGAGLFTRLFGSATVSTRIRGPVKGPNP